MEALPLVRSILKAAAGVTAKRTGDVCLNAAPEKEGLPNVVIASVGGGEGMTHAGPDGLLHDRVRIWARARSPKEAKDLGVAIDRALNGYTGTVLGASVQSVQKVMTMSDYQDGAAVQRSILDFRIWWRRAP